VPNNQIPIHPGQSPRLSSHSGVPVREDVAFANQKGVEKSGIRKRVERLLDKLQEPLRKFLEPDEAVFCIACAQLKPSGVEQLFLGWHAMFLMPGVLVFTNRRLLHFLIQRNGTWKRGLRCARWGDVEEANAKGLLGARLATKYRDGRKEVYPALAGEDAKKIQLLLECLIPAGAGETSPALTMTSLCPDCRSPLTPGVYECPRCRRAFKDEKTALQRSWLIPGGGFFYTGHPFPGILHGLVELILLIAAPIDAASALVVVAVLAIILCINKWVMARVAKKQVRNYIPVA
jgi:hypothetical protein